MDNDPDAPAPLALALGDAREYTVGDSLFLKGPLVVVEVPADGRIEVLDGPPFEASSVTVSTVSGSDMPAGGLMVGHGAYVVAAVDTAIRARMPQHYVFEVRQERTAEDQPPAKIIRMLERVGAEVSEDDAARKSGGFIARVSVPFNSREQVLEYLDLIGMRVEQVGGQAHLPSVS